MFGVDKGRITEFREEDRLFRDVLDEQKRLLVDSWAWIEYFSGTERGHIFRKYLEKGELYTPNVILLEIASKYAKAGYERGDILRRLLFIIKKSEVVEFDHVLALEAAKCLIELRSLSKERGLRRKPGIADGLILAIARRYRAKILTGDKHFEGLPEAIFIKLN